jgi:hypothetical protein
MSSLIGQAARAVWREWALLRADDANSFYQHAGNRAYARVRKAGAARGATIRIPNSDFTRAASGVAS